MFVLTRHPLTRSTRLLGVLAMASLATCLLAGGAEASCGDWLEGHGTMARVDHVPAGVGDVPAAADERPLGPSIPARVPCNGPSCGRGPVHLPFGPVESPVVPIDLERDAILVSVPVADSQGIRAHVVADAPVLPAALSGRPERPPRAG